MSSLTLKPHSAFKGVEGPVLVVVMDGVGIGAGGAGDAVQLARTPTLEALRAGVPSTQLLAHGTSVGLPSDEDMGNSEVGHNALGAGRVVDQGAKRVKLAIESGELFEGAEWRGLVNQVTQSGEPLHFVGLLSDGNVHSHIDHLFAMLRRAAAEGVEKARVHVLLDGRDVAETSALEYVAPLEQLLSEINGAADRDYRIASGGGRMQVTMDRYEADWGMVERGWNLHVRGKGRQFASAEQAIRTFRAEDGEVVDQNLPGFVIAGRDGTPVGPIRDGSSVVLFNFRGDRAIELCRAFEDDSFSAFDRDPRPNVQFMGMTQYDGDLHIPNRFLVAPPTIDETMGQYLAESGVRQFACSETQKYGHVTYFWNGNRSEGFDPALEHCVEIPSDALPFEERPWMKAAEITDTVIRELPNFRFGRINYPNGDMVGHTGDRDAAVQAVEAVDLCIRRLLAPIKELRGALLVTADHGNADEMYELDKSGSIITDASGVPRSKTSHTLNPVPLMIYAPSLPLRWNDVRRPGLANVAATSLQLLGFEAPGGFSPSLLGT